MFILARALTYATLFIGFFLVFLPGRLLARYGMSRPSPLGVGGLVGLLLVATGGLLALWCVLSFATHGSGTPFPLDPPRRLVVRGPYRWLRNPMYLGAVLALSGAALYFRSTPLLLYAALFLAATHSLVLWYEEPHLTRHFGDEYHEYRARVGRWFPRRPSA